MASPPDMESLRDAMMDTFFPFKEGAMQPAAPHTDDCDPDMGCDENCTTPLPPSTHCVMCGSKIEVMSFKGTKVCSTNCKKAARGETSDGWIETRAGRVKPYIGKKVRFDLIDPYLHIEGVLVDVKDSEQSPVARKIVLKDAKGKTKTIRRGQVVDTAAGHVPTWFDLGIDQRIDFKP